MAGLFEPRTWNSLAGTEAEAYLIILIILYKVDIWLVGNVDPIFLVN